MSTAAIIVRLVEHGDSWRTDRRSSTAHQLIWPVTGIAIVEAGVHRWFLSPALGLWICSDMPHTLECPRRASLYQLEVPPVACPITWTSPTAVAITTFLREAVVRLADPSLADGERSRTEAVLYDVLRPLTANGVRLPNPTDQRLRQITNTLLRDPADSRDLNEWGREVGAGTRTLTRLFSIETGMSFVQWRAQARMGAALATLADGSRVSDVARAVGYSTTSSFVHAFRRYTGTTPGAYLASLRAGIQQSTRAEDLKQTERAGVENRPDNTDTRPN